MLMSGPAIEPFGDAAWRIRLRSGTGGRAVLDALLGLPNVVDAVVCEGYALVTFEPLAPPDPVEVSTASCASSVLSSPPPVREHVIAVRYDGADLDEVARRVGLSREEVIDRHTSAPYTVAAIGFLPGFAYLRGHDQRLVVPRRASPRPRVPPLSVGIAGPYAGIYPFASPGGWNLIGTALDTVPFDSDVGAMLGLGDRVRFTRGER